MPAFSPERLAGHLRSLPATRYRIAFSGGLDSTVLVHALARLRVRLGAPIDAIHVNHQLHPEAGRWAEHCTAVCTALELPCEVAVVDARPRAGESPEAAARTARYKVFEARLREGEVLLTAHHRDDQTETVLQHFLRGAGVHGLAAMPMMRPLGRGRLGRPLLSFPRTALHRWAVSEGLEWIDDPSNRDPRFDRNFLRGTILPALANWRPGIGKVLVRNAELAAEAAMLLDEMAAMDLAAITEGEGALDAVRLAGFTSGRAKNAIRLWLRRADLPAPGSRHLQHILEDVLHARHDAEPRVSWPGAEVRRYRNRLYAGAPTPAVPVGWLGRFDDLGVAELPVGLGCLRLVELVGEGLRADIPRDDLRIGFRRGGERCHPSGRGGQHSLKKLFQEAGVPPWERARRPLLWLGDELVAVAGLVVCEPFAARPGEPAVALRWER